MSTTGLLTTAVSSWFGKCGDSDPEKVRHDAVPDRLYPSATAAPTASGYGVSDGRDAEMRGLASWPLEPALPAPHVGIGDEVDDALPAHRHPRAGTRRVDGLAHLERPVRRG